jgi:hypothetical protein
MKATHARVGRILAAGGHAEGPIKHPAPFYLLYGRNSRYAGWCAAKTIDGMTEAGLLLPRARGVTFIVWNDASDALRRELADR